jgi:hypothetical protein
VSVSAAVAVAAACGAIGIGIVIGLTAAGERGAQRALQLSREIEASGSETPTAQPPGVPAAAISADGGDLALQQPADLRGARLAHTTLVRADLRHADLRGATLTGADLSGANLTDALLGPLEDGGDGLSQS